MAISSAENMLVDGERDQDCEKFNDGTYAAVDEILRKGQREPSV